MSSINKLTHDNNYLMKQNHTAHKKLKKLIIKYNKKSQHWPLQTIWLCKDEIKTLKHQILINEQQVRFNLMLKQQLRLNNNG